VSNSIEVMEREKIPDYTPAAHSTYFWLLMYNLFQTT